MQKDGLPEDSAKNAEQSYRILPMILPRRWEIHRNKGEGNNDGVNRLAFQTTDYYYKFPFRFFLSKVFYQHGSIASATVSSNILGIPGHRNPALLTNMRFQFLGATLTRDRAIRKGFVFCFLAQFSLASFVSLFVWKKTNEEELVCIKPRVYQKQEQKL